MGNACAFTVLRGRYIRWERKAALLGKFLGVFCTHLRKKIIQQLGGSIFLLLLYCKRKTLGQYIYLFMQCMYSERAINLPSSSLSNKHRNLQMIKHCTCSFQALLATTQPVIAPPPVPYCVSLMASKTIGGDDNATPVFDSAECWNCLWSSLILSTTRS